jgi:hypothetical protein
LLSPGYDLTPAAMRNTTEELPVLKDALLHKNPMLPRQGFLGFQLGFNPYPANVENIVSF